MQHLEVSCAVRLFFKSLGFKGLIYSWQHVSVLVNDLEANTRGAAKSLARRTSRCILFDYENILFDASIVLFIYI